MASRSGAQYTPGPWKFDDVLGCREIKGDKYPPHRQGQYRPIASTHGLANDDEDRANARLISAAPDLLEALEWIVEDGASDSRALEVARAAILKATGKESQTS